MTTSTTPTKRRPLAQLMRHWLSRNRHGRLASDQWLNLVTKQLEVFIVLSVPLIMVAALTPLDEIVMLGLARYMRLLIPLFMIAVVVMLILRARRYARLPIYCEVLYLDKQLSPMGNRFRRQLTLYTEAGEAMRFSGFIIPPPYLEVDMRYLMYYLHDNANLVLLSYAPTEHPDIELWQPSSKFEARQNKRQKR